MLTIETNVTPELPVDISADEGTGLGASLLAFIQPAIRGDLAGFKVNYAPYGSPGGFGGIVFYGVLILAAYGAYRLVRR